MTAMEPSTPVLKSRYSREVALRHERLYGRGYQGPASDEVFTALANRLHLEAGMTVLELGCGLGGDTEKLAERYGVRVVAVDLSPDMVAICRERLDGRTDLDIEFVVGDMRVTPVVEETPFSVIWTRDCGAFVDLADKRRMWERLSANAPAGTQVLITDYCLGPTPPSDTFHARMKAWGQYMVDFDTYREILADAGFVDIAIEDRSVDLLESMYDGRTVLENERESFLAEMSLDDYDGLRERWDLKIGHCTGGQLAWLVLTARRS